MEARSLARTELMAAYRQPFRHTAVQTWRNQPELRRATALAAVLWLGGTAAVAAGANALLLLLAGVGAMFGTVVVVLWVVAILRAGWRQAQAGRETSEFAAIRAHRPQAGTEDPTVMHDEFAVAVDEDGHLVTWRFRPLRVSEEPIESEIEVPGRPRYAASPIDVTEFDVQDTARASEQLVTAQSQAADWETESAAAAHRALDGSHADAELAAEARTTAAALQRATGQTPRRR